MNGALPHIYWYVFFALAILLTIGAITYGATLEHRRRMRALDILRMYAEKGEEPPKAILDGLAAEILEAEAAPSMARKRQGALIQGFVGMLFSACATGGIAWWLLEAGGPRWAFILMACGTLFFGVSALGMLLAALVKFAARDD